MLHHDILAPDAPGRPVLVLMHGRGSDERDLAPLARLLAPDSPAVLIRAPFEAAPLGYGTGWAWYRFLGGTRPDPDHFESSQQALSDLLDALPHLGLEGPAVVGGFSQGGTMGIGQALRRPGSVAGVLNLSGFVPDHPTVRTEAAAGLPVFWGHGTADGNVPFALARAGRAAFQAGGADLHAWDFTGGHTITQDEVAEARRWLGRLAAAVQGGSR
ncbi:MAG: alpha/beta hydrolase [Gemmatimonadales bacterium]